MTTKCHCESSLGSFDECSAVHKRLSTLRPSHLTWAVSPPVGSCRLQPPSPFIIITQPESWYSFIVPRRVEGCVDLGTAGKVHTARAQGCTWACKSQWLCDKHNCPQQFDSRTSRTAVRHATARPLRPACYVMSCNNIRFYMFVGLHVCCYLCVLKKCEWVTDWVIGVWCPRHHDSFQPLGTDNWNGKKWNTNTHRKTSWS